MIKTVIFDWAGTTVDFGCMAPVHAFRNAFLEKGIQLTDKEIREPMGKLKWDHIQQLLSLPSVKKQWIAIYGQLPQEKRWRNCINNLNIICLKIWSSILP